MKMPWTKSRGRKRRLNNFVVRMDSDATQTRRYKDGGPAMFGLEGNYASTADADIYEKLARYRYRCREGYQNSPLIRNAVDTFSRETLRSGVVLKPEVRLPDGKRDKETCDGIKDAWEEWSEDYCDVTGRRPWNTMEQLVLNALMFDGEAFVRLRSGGPFGLRLEFIEPWRIDVTKNEELKNGNRVIMGIEVDKDNKPVAYNILSDVLPNQAGALTTKRTIERVEADNILHVFHDEYVRQTRGMPMLATVINLFADLAAYSKAELRTAQINAVFSGFLTQTEDDLEFEGEEDVVGDDSVTVGFTEDVNAPRVINASPGHFPILPPGVEPRNIDPKHPNSNYAAYHKANVAQGAAGIGMNYNDIAGDLSGTNFSAGRLARLTKQEMWNRINRLLTSQMRNPVYRKWLKVATAKGELDIMRELRPRELHRAKWIVPKAEHIQPRESAAATEMELRMGTKTRTEVAAERGVEYEDLLREMAEEKQLMEQYGLNAFDTKPGEDAESGPEEIIDEETGEKISNEEIKK